MTTERQAALDKLAELAVLNGWRQTTIRRGLARDGQWSTIATCAGWPDMFAWRPGRMLAIWVTDHSLDPVRKATAASLAEAGVEVFTWSPADGPDAIETALAARGTR